MMPNGHDDQKLLIEWFNLLQAVLTTAIGFTDSGKPHTEEEVRATTQKSADMLNEILDRIRGQRPLGAIMDRSDRREIFRAVLTRALALIR